MDCFAAVYQTALARNIRFATDDLLPPVEADVVVYMAFPDSRRMLDDQRRKNPRAKRALVLLETALGARYTRNPRNHSSFDVVFTYDSRLVDGQRYFALPPHAYNRNRIRTGPSFEHRRTACLVGANRTLRYRSGLFTARKGWKLSLRDWLDYAFCPGQLLTYRSKVGRLCARMTEGTFDVFGEGWDVFPETRQASLGVPGLSTLDYVGNYRYYFALENHSGPHSLISERIWDALWGDCVPVYLGNRRIAEVVPPECFVDARAFDSPAELLESLVRSSSLEWQRMRDAGRAFIAGVDVEPFLPHAFAEAFLPPIEMLGRETGWGHPPVPERIAP